MRPIYITRALAVAADPDGIALDQAIPLGNLVLTGAALVVAGVAQLSAQRQVILTPGAGDDLTGINFTLYGTDDQGHAISEVIAGTNNTVMTSVLDYRTITRIAASAAGGVGETVSVGTNGVGASAPVPMDQYVPDFTVMIAVILKSGAANFTVQYTFDDVFLKYAPYNTNYPGQPAGDPATITWWNHSDITTQAANAKGALVEPVKAIRLLTNSGVGVLELQIIQGGSQ